MLYISFCFLFCSTPYFEYPLMLLCIIYSVYNFFFFFYNFWVVICHCIFCLFTSSVMDAWIASNYPLAPPPPQCNYEHPQSCALWVYMRIYFGHRPRKEPLDLQACVHIKRLFSKMVTPVVLGFLYHLLFSHRIATNKYSLISAIHYFNLYCSDD